MDHQALGVISRARLEATIPSAFGSRPDGPSWKAEVSYGFLCRSCICGLGACMHTWCLCVGLCMYVQMLSCVSPWGVSSEGED